MEADALIGLGRLGDAEVALNDFESAIPRTGLASAALTLARCRGNLAVANGEAAQAETAFAKAHSMGTNVAMPFERALLCLDDGRRLRWVEDKAGSDCASRAGASSLLQPRADPYVEACAAELLALEAPVWSDAPAVANGLSRAELAVARLVADRPHQQRGGESTVRLGEDRRVPPPELFHEARHLVASRAGGTASLGRWVCKADSNRS